MKGEDKGKNTRARVQNFYKRWNIEYGQQERVEGFKNRVLITLETLVKHIMKDPSASALLMDYFKLIGLYISEGELYDYWGTYDGDTLFVEKVKFELQAAGLEQTIFLLQNLFYLDLSEGVKNQLYENLRKDIELSLLDIKIKKVKSGEYIFCPAGAKLLDEGVVNDVLDWLAPYSKSYKNFESALKKYQEHKYERNLIDDLRLSLDLLLKSIFKNEKSLENQKESLGIYLAGKSTPKDIRNMFETLVAYYINYQNEHVKHNDKVRESEVEFMIYLTGTFMRFLLSLETNLNNSR